MEMPDRWRVSSDETATVINARWWEQFEDTVLNDLIQEALDSNHDLRIATARIAQFQAQLGITSSQLYPQIYAEGSRLRQKNSQTLFGRSSLSQPAAPGQEGTAAPNVNEGSLFYINDYRAVLSAAFELDLWGKIRSATEASFAELIGQVEARRAVILSIISSVAIAYMQLRQYDSQLQISMQTLQSREQSFELANIRFLEGFTSKLEVQQAAADRDEAALQVIQFQTLIPQQENLLSILIGHPPAAIRRGRAVEGWRLPPQVPTGLPADLLEQRPDIMQAEQQLIAANFRIGEARALYFPTLTLTGSNGYESGQLRELFTHPSRTWEWMVNLLQPLLTAGQITSTVDLTIAKKEEALYHYLQTVLKALQEVDNALIAHQKSKEAVVAQNRRLRDLEEYLDLATLQYESGLVDDLNVLDAERRLFEAQLNFAQNQANVFITLVDIYKALGGGWVVDAENLILEKL